MNSLKYAQQICYSSKETLQFSYEMGIKYKDTDGIYIECGTAAGAQVIAMAYGAPTKSIYAFDSFAGIPLPSNRDDQMPGIRRLMQYERSQLPNPGEQVLESSGATSVTRESFLEHINNSGINMPERIYAIQGWFEETVPKVVDMWNQAEGFHKTEIAILRLDGDLYNSTIVCLKHLFPKVIDGGCVIVDDWELQGCRDACIDYFNSIKYFPKYQHISNIVYFFK